MRIGIIGFFATCAASSTLEEGLTQVENTFRNFHEGRDKRLMLQQTLEKIRVSHDSVIANEKNLLENLETNKFIESASTAGVAFTSYVDNLNILKRKVFGGNLATLNNMTGYLEKMRADLLSLGEAAQENPEVQTGTFEMGEDKYQVLVEMLASIDKEKVATLRRICHYGSHLTTIISKGRTLFLAVAGHENEKQKQAMVTFVRELVNDYRKVPPFNISDDSSSLLLQLQDVSSP